MFLSLARALCPINNYTESGEILIRRCPRHLSEKCTHRRESRERERKYKKWHQVGSVCGMRRARSERARERSSLRVGKRRRVPCTWIKGQVDQFTCCQSDQHLASCARQPLHVQLMLSNSHHSYSTCFGYMLLVLLSSTPTFSWFMCKSHYHYRKRFGTERHLHLFLAK
jgi:hypothetical protein